MYTPVKSNGKLGHMDSPLKISTFARGVETDLKKQSRSILMSRHDSSANKKQHPIFLSSQK
jgi:hypothetical protein